MVIKSFTCPNGHQWRDADECKRCPVCGGEAETVGNGSSQLESTGAGPTTVGSTTSDDSQLYRFGRYRIVDELGHGGMGIVYRAYDPVHQRHVALKRLPKTDPTLLSRFKHEFRVLADLVHPNVVKLYELTSEGGTWFFTMEVIDGVDLLTYVCQEALEMQAEVMDHVDDENDSRLTVSLSPRALFDEKSTRLRDGFSQLAGAIAALHAGGIVHRDIKPSNVIVTPEGRAVLLDFGLAAQTDQSGSHLSLHQDVLGTAAYMSPEQAACDPVSAASDWYSLGVMLYQTLTGRLPYSGKLIDILAKKQKRDPVPPCEIEPSVSKNWNDLCLHLLSRRPEDRPGAEDVLQRLGSPTRQQALPKAHRPDEHALVGRESELQSLHNTWEAVQSGQAKCVLIEGGSGTGKSSLIEAFVEQATCNSAVALTCRCYEMESVPFKAIDSLVDTLVEHLSHLPKADAAALMPRDVHSLAQLFPVFGKVESVARLPRRQIDRSDQKELNRHAIGALRELLARMGDRYPLIVYIDDLQWGDEDSAAMLSDLLQPPDPPVLLFLGTYRSEDTNTSQFLQSFWQIQRQRELPLDSHQVELTPLEHSDAVKLALALLKSDEPDAGHRAESIARESAGNPFFVSELVKHLRLEGERVFNPTEPSVLFDMIWSRVQRLPDEAQALLAVVALSGQPMPLEQAMRIACVGQSAIGPLRTGHFIRTGGLAPSSKIETYHDRVRESVSLRLDTQTKRRLHFRIAEDYVRRSSLTGDEIMERLSECFAAGSAHINDYLDVAPGWYEVAIHFDAAGRPDLAFPYALATAEKSRTQFSSEIAERQYRIAERGTAGRNKVIECRLAEGLGDVLMLRGDYGEAKVRFDRALELLPASSARIETKLGELALKQGDMEKTIRIFERVLGLLGHNVPRRSWAIWPRLAREAFVQILHSCFPPLFIARRKLESVENQLLVIRLHNRLTYAYWFKRGKFLCLWCHLRGMNLAECYPPTRELAHAYSIHAPLMGLVARFSRGIAYAQKSLAIYISLGDLWGQGQALNFHGVVLHAASRFEEGTHKCRDAVQVLERSGDLWEVNVARVHAALCLFGRGDLAAAAELAKRVHFSGVELGDAAASGFSLDVWAWSTGGQVPVEVLQAELQRPRENVQATTQVMMAEGVRLFMLDRAAEAAVVFEKAYLFAEQAGVRSVYVLALRSWHASALRRRAEKIGPSESGRAAAIKRASKAARKAVRVARTFQNDLPHALREAGLISAMQGSGRRARKYFDESLGVAERQGARFEYAQTLLARGRVGLTLEWPGAAEQMAAGRQDLIELSADFALSHLEVPDHTETV